MYYVIGGGFVSGKLCQRAADLNFDALGHTFRNRDVVLAAHVLANVGREVVTGHLNGVVRNDTAHRDNGNLRGSAADVHDHVAFRGIYVETDTDGCGHGLINEINVATAGVFGAVAHGTELNFGGAGGHSDHHSYAGSEEMSAGSHHIDEAAHHLLASVEVGDHTILQRTDHADLFARLFIHEFGAFADGDGFVRARIEGNDRRFVDGDLTIGNNDGVGRAQVHGQLAFHREKGGENSHWAMRLLESGAREVACWVNVSELCVRPFRTSRGWPCRSAKRWRKRVWQSRDARRVWFLHRALLRFRAGERSLISKKRSPHR